MLVNQEQIKNETIDNLIRLSGSKFFYSFTSNPFALFKWLINNSPELFADFQNNTCEISIITSPKTYLKGIGYDNLININLLTEKEKETLISEQREEFQIFSVHRATKVVTWQINCILFIEDGTLHIKTIFPGIMTPPFPDNSYQDEADFKKNISFWSEYAFIK
jgi:hypothetical protein